MSKNVIVSEKTLLDLLEAHASLCAWYYELATALRAAQGVVKTPDDGTRTAFVPQLAADFPELAALSRSIRVPRVFVPPPPAFPGGAPAAVRDQAPTLVEPAVARTRDSDDELPRPSIPPDAPPVK